MQAIEVIFVVGTNFLIIALHISVLCIPFDFNWFINENVCGGFHVVSHLIGKEVH